MSYKAIYAFSGDPITFGHIDVITRAIRSFGSVLVAIGKNPAKDYLFTLEERFEMATEALKDIPNVKVTKFRGLLTDFASQNNINIVVRGIRSSSDFDYEKSLYQIGLTQKTDIEFHYLMAAASLTHVSSGAVKAIKLENGEVDQYVPKKVQLALDHKFQTVDA